MENNVKIAQAMIRLALKSGYAPIAPHLLYPQGLSDDVPENREIGLAAGLAWIPRCNEMWIWGDSGVSEGMRDEIDEGLRTSRLQFRTITAYEVSPEPVDGMRP